jgi:hypothetical protein
MYVNDLASGKFEPDLFIKEKEQVAGLHTELKSDFKMLINFFKELQWRSPYFPMIDFDTFSHVILNSKH